MRFMKIYLSTHRGNNQLHNPQHTTHSNFSLKLFVVVVVVNVIDKSYHTRVLFYSFFICTTHLYYPYTRPSCCFRAVCAGMCPPLDRMCITCYSLLLHFPFDTFPLMFQVANEYPSK